MIETIIICGAWALFCAVASHMYIEHRKKKIQHDAVVSAVETYTAGLKRFTEGSAEKCPNCAYSHGGCICKDADMENLVRFGTCTRFEERRY